jgi:hypothetical protein
MTGGEMTLRSLKRQREFTLLLKGIGSNESQLFPLGRVAFC